MVTRLQKMHVFVSHAINDAMLLRQTPRPCPGGKMLQRLGLSDAGERFAKNRFDELQCTSGDPAVVRDPVAEIVSKLRVNNREPLASRRHA